MTAQHPTDSLYSTIDVVTFNCDFALHEDEFVDDLLEIMERGADVIILQEAKHYNLAKVLRKNRLDMLWDVIQWIEDEAHMGSAILIKRTRSVFKWEHCFFGIGRNNHGMLDRYIVKGGIKVDNRVLVNVFGWHNPPWRYRLLIGPMTSKVLDLMLESAIPSIGGADHNTRRRSRAPQWLKHGFSVSKHKGIDGLVWSDPIQVLDQWTVGGLHSDHDAKGVSLQLRYDNAYHAG